MLLGSFSLDVLGQVSQALIDQDSSRMLDIVDGLERNGQNLQHFARELARYFRNLLVARIAGENSRLIAASTREIAEMARVAGQLSEPDLTRYLQLSLDLFKDLQVSLQPRFHLEVGLLRLVHAGRLTSIEQALADWGQPEPAAPSGGPAPAKTPLVTQPVVIPPARRGPSPFELDRAKKAGSPIPRSSGANALAPAPNQEIDWRAQLLDGLNALGLTFTADAMSHANVAYAGNELQIQLPTEFKLVANPDELYKALAYQQLGSVKLKLSFGGENASATPSAVRPPTHSEVTVRALEHPGGAAFPGAIRR